MHPDLEAFVSRRRTIYLEFNVFVVALVVLVVGVSLLLHFQKPLSTFAWLTPRSIHK